MSVTRFVVAEAFVKVLSEIQGYLVDKNYDECWEYIKTVKKEISEDIIKDTDSRQTTGI